MRADGLILSDLLCGTQIETWLLHALPKVDLHVHLDGSLRFSTYVELCRDRGIPLAGGDETTAEAIFRGASGPQTLDAYIALFEHPIRALQSAAALERVAREIVEDCAAENVWHAEVRFSPSLHTEGGLSREQATDAVLAGLDAGREATGISAGLIISGVRHRGAEEVRELAELTVAYKHRGVIGFDLAGAEADNPPKRYREAFYLILNNNINCTVHAGEAWGPDSIQQALHYLSAHRIGHGTRLEEDPELKRYVADHRIPVEVGVSSSVRTRSLPDHVVHPLRRFLRDGLRVTLTTNNRLFLSRSLTEELRKVVDEFDLTLLELENLQISGFKSAFLPRSHRVELMHKVIEEFARLRTVLGDEVEE